MSEIKETINMINSFEMKQLFQKMYKNDERTLDRQKNRYIDLINHYEKHYGNVDVQLFSSPGRIEISGNHTDHNLGKVMAGSINLDCIAVVGKTDDNKVSINSLTYNEDFTIELDKLDNTEKDSSAMILVKGILEGMKDRGYRIGGFTAAITSDVISAAGVSSSASFEMLICSILNYYYNDNTIDIVTCGKIGQYAENVKWNKKSGLLDQIACGHGGLITIDFKNIEKPVIKLIDSQSISQRYDIIIIPTGANHADLSDEYSAIPDEMKSVAKYLGYEVLREVKYNDILDNFAAIREVAGDRAILRAMHFIEENKRVDQLVEVLHKKNYNGFIQLITASGNSSWKWLQNCYANRTANRKQAVTLYLALTELFIKEKQVGACRVHGGGFAGVIMAVLPQVVSDDYISYMKQYNKNDLYKVKLRDYGTINLNMLIEK